MPTWCLEMRSTERWTDVRYRDYTNSKKVAEAFKAVPKVRFSDSGHGVVPVVSEHRGRRLPRVRSLSNYVSQHMPQRRSA